MKIIQSFWTGNRVNGNCLSNSGGWPAPEYHWMSWALSCLQLKKIFGEVELITDSLGKQILIDKLHLPYDKVTIALDNILNGYPDDLWALAKVHSYSIQENPFLHFDGDFYLWAPFEEKILSAPLLVQNQERDLPLYRMALDEINQHYINIPPCFKRSSYENKPVISINAGVIGGTDLHFFKLYRNAAFDFIKSNLGNLSSVKLSNLNFIFEQYYLYCLAETHDVPITYASDKVVDSLIYGEYVNFSKIPNIQFIHPVGGHKKNIEVCDHLSKKLRMEYPEFHQTILGTLNQSGIPISGKVNRSNGLSTRTATGNHNKDHDMPPAFVRTLASVNYLLAAYQITPTAQIARMTGELNEETAFENLANTLPLQDRDRQLLVEIYGVEKIKSQAYKEAFQNNEALSLLGVKDAARYEYMQKNFSMQNQSIPEIKITSNDQIKLARVKNNWTHDHANTIEEVVQYNFGDITRTEELMVFVPQILRMEVDEYLLDALDVILFNFCTETKTVKEILQHASGAFEEDEIAGNYPAFFNLIVGSIIRLSYLNILCVKTNLNN